MIHHPVIIGTKLVILLIIAVVLFILHSFLTPGEFKIALTAGVVFFVLAVIATWTVAGIMLKNPDSLLSKMMVLDSVSKKNPVYKDPEGRELASMLHMQGIADSELRPSGIGLFKDKRIQVIAKGVFIPKGNKIKVTRVTGNNVYVEEVKEGGFES